MALPKWKIENDLCRCCHSEGSYVNLAGPRIVGGEIEVYSEMIMECFNIVLSPVQGELNEVTYGICENCANKVRDALNFKNQVLECEKKFEAMYRQNCIVVSDLLQNVKIEIDISDGEEKPVDIDFKKQNDPMVDENDDGLEDSGDDFFYPGDLDSNTEDNVIERHETSDKDQKITKKQPKNSKKPTKTTRLKKTATPQTGNAKTKQKKTKEIVVQREDKKKGDADTAKRLAPTGDKVTGLKGVCAVAACNNRGVHLFPSNPITRQLWVKATRVDVQRKMGYQYDKHTRVCRDHFTPEDFLGGSSWRKLKKPAVPSIFPWSPPDVIKSNEERKLKMKMKNIIKAKPVEVVTFDPSKAIRSYSRPGPKFHLRENDYTLEEDGMMKCTKCSRNYINMSSLRYHVRTNHYKVPKYICPYCSKGFMTVAPFIAHKFEEHNVDERIHCNACKGVFNTKVQLKKHTNSFHMMGIKYKCDMCDYESFSCESLYKHKFKHNTVKNNHCKFCKKSFLRRATLVLHERIHTGDRRKVCKVCGQAFVQKASLNYHMSKYHPEVIY